jgi:hypothetical protein
MIRRAWLLVLLAGCAGAGSKEEGPLDRLISASNAYGSFHLRAEISDGRTSAPVEMAWQAPDRALLKYGTIATTVIRGSTIHHYLRGSFYKIDILPVVSELRTRYADLSVGDAPVPIFTQGDGVRTLLSIGRLGARLGWLEELKAYKAEGNVYRNGATLIELRPDGFIARSEIAGTKFVIKDLTIDQPLPETLFELPPTTGLADISERSKKDLARGMEDAWHRWILEQSTEDATLNALARIDLVRRYDPDRMAEVLKASLTESLKAFKDLNPASRPEVLRDKLLIDRGRAMGSIEIMEEEIQREAEKSLDGWFRAMVPLPPASKMQEVARRWKEAWKRQVDELIRKRFEATFDAVQKDNNP